MKAFTDNRWETADDALSRVTAERQTINPCLDDSVMCVMLLLVLPLPIHTNELDPCPENGIVKWWCPREDLRVKINGGQEKNGDVTTKYQTRTIQCMGSISFAKNEYECTITQNFTGC